MKLTLTILTLALVFATATAFAEVATTKHNLSSSGPGTIKSTDSNSEICVFCHTPHNANTDVHVGLWNRKTHDSGDYEMYDGSTGTPNEESMICLTCHDGTVAINSMANMPGTLADTYTSIPMTGTGVVDGKLTSASYAFIGTDLTDDHPIGDWPDTAGYYPWNLKPLADIVAAQAAAGHYSAKPTPSGDSSSGYRVECISCHGVHSNPNGSFLLQSNAGSALCIACHSV